MHDRPYNYRECSSLFGYASSVHARSGAVCQLCGCGGRDIDFDLWRQFSVEHLIGLSQGGYTHQIREAVARRFPRLAPAEQADLVQLIDEANTVSACTFCNSTTSRDRAPTRLDTLILETPGSAEAVLDAIRATTRSILDKKRVNVRWKLASVREAFRKRIEPALRQARGEYR